MAFRQIIGNETAVALLSNSIKNQRTGHAYIIEGRMGTGRMSIAKAFAQEILKTDKLESHPDFAVITNQYFNPAKKQKQVLVDTVRALRKDAYVRPYMAEKKIYVIPNADTMEAPAQNSLLKIFEEPPSYCIFILLAENGGAFLPTILSRAVTLRTQPLPVSGVCEYLVSKGIGREDAVKYAAMSGGSIGKALELAENQESKNLREEIFRHIFSLVEGTYKDMYEFIKFIKAKDGEREFIFDTLESWSRDVMKIKLLSGEAEIVNVDKETELRGFCSRVPKTSALKFTEITVNYRNMIDKKANFPIAVLCMVTEYWEEIHGRNRWS